MTHRPCDTRPPARRATAAAVLLLGAALIAFALLPASPTLAQDGEDAEVSATAQLTFEPEEITVTEGTTVTWVWEGGGAHTVTSQDEPGAYEPNGEYDYELTEDSGPVEHTFDEAGTYYYYCKPHAAQGMEGTVVVEAEEEETPTDDETQTEDETEEDDGLFEEDPGETDTPTDTPEEEEDTPGVAPVLLLVAMAAVLMALRRSRD